jgi:hypothetical protein
MCQANGKEWSAYARRKAAKAYWEGLANDLRINISSLIIQIDAYGDDQATWVHPEIAIDLAQWVSVAFKIWANRTLTKLVSGEIVHQPQTPAEMLVVFAQQLVEQERRSKELAEKQQLLESKTDALDERTEHLQNRIEALNGASNYYTVRGYCRVKNIKIAEGMARQVAFAAKRICKSQGFSIGKVPDERHGEVNSYPDSVLAEAIASALKAS